MCPPFKKKSIIFFKLPDGVPYLKYLDPSGALLIGIYIIYSWWKMGAGKQCKNNLSTLLQISRYVINAIFLFQNTHVTCLVTVQIRHSFRR